MLHMAAPWIKEQGLARSAKGKAAARKNTRTASRQPRKAQSASRAARVGDVDHLLDEKSRRDIAGVICAVAGIVLFLAACLPSNGLVTEWLSNMLHIGLGIGAFLLPIVLLLIAAVLFIGRVGEKMSVRVALGLIILFFSLLTLFAVFTPNVASSSSDVLFQERHLIAQGGYAGALIAWVLLTLFGQQAAAVVAIGAILIALIVIGFSVNGLVEKVRSMRQQKVAEEQAENKNASANGMEPYQTRTRKVRRAANSAGATGQQKGEDAMPTARIVRGRASAASPTEPLSPLSRAAAAVGRSDTQALIRTLGKKKSASKSAGGQSTPARSAGAVPHPSEGFELPAASLLMRKDPRTSDGEGEETLRQTAQLLQDTLADFGVDVSVEGWAAGPTVTLFKVALPSGVRVSRVTGLTDDIALAMASQGVRIFSPVPGTNYVGIEVPNVNRRTVFLGDVLDVAGAGPLQVAIGEDVEGHPIVNDLAKMPHLLVAGTTGSGKSVAINGMIMSILMRATPAEVRFIMIDPKRVEFTPYNGIPHLYVPVVTECKEAASALSWAVAEMERRLKLFSKVGARNIAQYNSKAQNGMMISDEAAEEIPYIVIVIDELADLMMNVGKEVEFSISRLAQLARAAGIHMIIATQRPSTNVVTGLIKANITNRMALTVASGIDSRVILDATGAENLIGNGDMLYGKPEYPKPQRLQGCFTSNKEIESVVDHLKAQGEPEYHQEILQTNVMSIGDTMPDGSGGRSSSDDPLIWDAAEIVVNSGFGSTSNIQRRLKVGYSRAGRIMDMLEEKGIVGPPNGSKPREVLVDTMELETLKAFEMNDEDSGE